jgi:hypothetical protein
VDLQTRGGDTYMATTGDLNLATSGDFYMATDTALGHCCIKGARAAEPIRRGVNTPRGGCMNTATPFVRTKSGVGPVVAVPFARPRNSYNQARETLRLSNT